MTQIIKLENISFAYKNRKGQARKAVFENFSLSVERGAKLVVKGKSGAGKSTLLRLMAWLEEPDAGTMFFEDKPYGDYAPPALRKSVSLVRQTPVMLDGSVRHNLLLGGGEGIADSELLEWMEKLGLERELLDRSADALSVGQQQRVAVIRTLLLKPAVLLLDEPTSGLDRESAEMFADAMERLIEESGLTVVWVSHDVEVLKSSASQTLTVG